MGYGKAHGQAPHARDIEEPLGTIVAGGIKHAMVAASLVQYYKSGSQNVAVDRLMPTIVTKDRVGVTCTYLCKHSQGVVGVPVDQPAPQRVGWFVREIEEWAEARPISDIPPPPNTANRNH